MSCYWFTLENGKIISEQEIMSIISNFIFEVIKENIPYKWIPGEEPFINKYNGNISYDYSGEVKIMTIADLKILNKGLNNNNFDFYTSKLDALLSQVYIDSWEATYVSNYGKSWVSYKDLLETKYNEWKYSNFELYNEDGEELDEDLDIELDDLFSDIIEDTSYELYYVKLLNNLKTHEKNSDIVF